MDEAGSGQGAGALGREGTFAIEGVVGINGQPLAMDGHGDATAQVADDEVEVFVALAVFAGKAAGDGLLVEGVPDADARHKGRTADARHLVELVNHARVGNQGKATWDALCQFVGNDTAEVAGVFADGVVGVFAHLLVDTIDAARHGTGQTAAAHDDVKLHRDA